MNAWAAARDGAESPRRVHPIARIDYVSRIVGCPMGAVVVASVRFNEPTPTWIWVALAAYAIVWPHLAYWLAHVSRDPKRTEYLCLMFDCACFGASGWLVSFRLVPTVVMSTGILTAVASAGGARLFWAGLGVLGAVYVAGFLVWEPHAEVETPIVTIALSLTLAFLFQLLLAIQTYRQARALNQTRRQIEEQTAHIVKQNEALARAMVQAEEDRKTVEAATLAKSRFLANMSHELRTPLNAILGYTELIIDGTYGELPDRVRATLQRVERSGRLLLGLVNEVLDLSRIEAGQLKLDVAAFALSDTVGAAVTSLESLAREKGLKLVVDTPAGLPPALGDERRIMQVLVNLIGNAIKFTDAGEVEVRAKLDDDTFAVTIRDTGPGVPAEFRTRIFEEFQQADTSTTRPKGGAGLGLAISKRIVEMHGGTLALLHSEPGRGSTFGFTLPRAGPPGAKAATSPAPVAASTP